MGKPIDNTEIDLIVEGCRNNNSSMQSKLYYTYYPGIYSAITRYVTDDGERDDILQETFIKVFSNIKKLKESHLVFPWMKRIAVNLCMDKLRRDKRLNLSFDEYLANRPSADYEEDDYEPDSVDGITMEDVNDVLDQLPNGFRTVFMLYAIEDYSHREIAIQLGTSESNSKTQYMRAKNAIKNLVKQKLACKGMK